MPVVKVRTAKCCTVPKSASTSISASATPPTIAGRASGAARTGRYTTICWPSLKAAEAPTSFQSATCAGLRR